MRTLTKTDAPMRYCLLDTAIGSVGVAWSNQGLARLQLPEASRQATERRLRGRSLAEPGEPPLPIRQAMGRVEKYLAGDRIEFASIVLDLAGIGAFHRRIYETLRSVAWGETTTYGALARQAGDPHAARAVGQAMGRNPIPLIIPCHRVLASGGKPGGFSAFGGVITKQRLLALEGARLGNHEPLLPGLIPAGA